MFGIGPDLDLGIDIVFIHILGSCSCLFCGAKHSPPILSRGGPTGKIAGSPKFMVSQQFSVTSLKFGLDIHANASRTLFFDISSIS